MFDFAPIKMLVSLLIIIVLIWAIRHLLVLAKLGKRARQNAHRARQSAQRGYEYEKNARSALVSMGFKVLEHQPSALASYWIDEKYHETKITSDYLVEHQGERAIIEVKSGRKARATHRDTRRQLFEYHHTFDVDAIYLFDVESNRLQRVDFGEEITTKKPAKMTVFWCIAAAFLGFFAGYYLTH